ncbi:uncharacterized protein YPO0396 [Pedobacter sp. AK017]|uniref:hypothetical protein n=1 Tax=Pedobacter sp. AK017 TaxID=2723073 RepID=UPI00161088FE|nr:hypothetical protein [Pedobacter sp. AK017]MBB5437709.1 uncharacterized protein YPO0396 [Pedobacter sp. AK017]
MELYFPIVDSHLSGKELRLNTIDKERDQFKRHFEGEQGELKKLRHKLGMLRSTVERKMREIKEHSKVEYNEISESIDARSEYIAKYEKLKTEDLKRHENRFKEELNKNTINKHCHIR